mmetsp:Transcript_26869/g.53666  ORF Transcript_26869/g.53666 Transcript_26869/m.53666 type:complete len:256 (+) Transcript_26869:996-1763(+)
MLDDTIKEKRARDTQKKKELKGNEKEITEHATMQNDQADSNKRNNPESDEIKTMTTCTDDRSYCQTLVLDLSHVLFDHEKLKKTHQRRNMIEYLIEITGEKTGDEKFDAVTTHQQDTNVVKHAENLHHSLIKGMTIGGFNIDRRVFERYAYAEELDYFDLDPQLRAVLMNMPYNMIISSNLSQDTIHITSYTYKFPTRFKWECENYSNDSNLLALDEYVINKDVSKVAFLLYEDYIVDGAFFDHAHTVRIFFSYY